MEILVSDILYTPPFIHVFALSHSEIVKVPPEPHHMPPRIIVVGKPHAINMATTGRALMSVQAALMEMIRLQLGSSLPDTARRNAYQALGMARQLDIIIEQNHRLHSLVQSILPPAPTEEPHAYKRLVTRIKRTSTGVNEATSSTQWSTSPVTISHPPQNTQEQPLIIPVDSASSAEDSDTTQGKNVTPIKRRRPATSVPQPDIAS
jgi:hypothetical protein